MLLRQVLPETTLDMPSGQRQCHTDGLSLNVDYI